MTLHPHSVRAARSLTVLCMLLGARGASAATLSVADLVEGDLVIDEVMPDPSKVDDTKGEWFEIANTSGEDVDLMGLVLSDDGTNHATVSSSVVVPAGGTAVFAPNSKSKQNGGIPAVDVVVTLSAFRLDNAADEIILSYGSTVFDRFAWGPHTGFTTVPGVAFNLDIDHINATDNDKVWAWCDASTPYGLGDLGTPGDANDDCGPDPVMASDLVRGDLVISEVMIQPTKTTEAKGEWFEIYNASGTTVDLHGLILKDRVRDHYTVPSDVIAKAGTYVLLAANATATQNGGLPTVNLAYTRASLQFNNSADQIILSNGTTTIDEVAWTTHSTLSTGASWTLDGGHLSADGNDTDSAWCVGTASYGLGDKGSPGAANGLCGDADGDGYVAASDCNDGNASVHPGAAELCNSVDDDCDGLVDESATDATTWALDADGDGYGSPAHESVACTNPHPGTYVSNAGDCDDGSAEVNPAASELCGDGIDNNCDGSAVGCELMGDLDLGVADAKLSGNGTTTDASRGLSGVGDINGDGYDDICVGAPSTSIDAGATSSGAAYVVFGPVSGDYALSTDADAVLSGETGGDQAGYSVSGDGDQDADGYADLLVGARDESTHGAGAGAVYVVNGPMSGALGLSSADAKLEGEAASDVSGFTESGGGDMDGDGVPDLSVGAYGSSRSLGGAGAVYLLQGPVTGTHSLSRADAIWVGDNGGDHAGRSISSDGDVDGDGNADLLVGTPNNDADGALMDAGRAYLVTVPLSGTGDLADADAILTGVAAGEQAGTSVASDGDMNGDGYCDLLITSVAASPVGANSGAAYLLYGPLSGSHSLSTADLKMTGVAAGDHAGARAAFVGDTNNDGFGDLLVGAYGQDTGGSNAGAAYLIDGPATGTLSLSAADARMLGEVANAKAGTSVAGAGDVNGDGYSDLLVGAVSDPSGGTYAGAAYLVLGDGW